MITGLRTITALLLATLCATTANAAVFAIPAAQMGAIYNPGTIPIGIPAISIVNAPATFFDFQPNLASPNGYVYSTDGSTNPTAGLFPDYHFLGSAGTVAGSSLSPIWTFAAFSSEYYLYPTTDHTPIPNEALESSIWGSNNGGSTWIQGTVAEVYEQGWNAAGLPDDGATRWTFSSPVNIISAVVGLTQGAAGSPLPPWSYGDGDFETDAVMQAVPEPSSIALVLCGGTALLIGRLRRRAFMTSATR